jgi:hypothetical protein
MIDKQLPVLALGVKSQSIAMQHFSQEYSSSFFILLFSLLLLFFLLLLLFSHYYFSLFIAITLWLNGFHNPSLLG